MKCLVTYHELKPTTREGYGVQLVQTYTSLDKSEIDALCKQFDSIKSGVSITMTKDE